MPRRRDLARRTTLARAAIEVLRARGVQTSMRELAAALGIKRPTLYFYFPDLAAVYEAARDPRYRAMSEAVAARMREHDHPLDRLRAAIAAVLAFHRDQPVWLAALIQRAALSRGEPGTGFEEERRAMTAARALLVAELRDGLSRKEIRPCDPARVIDVVVGFLAGAVAQRELGLDVGDGAADELAARVLEPLRARRRKRRARP